MGEHPEQTASVARMLGDFLSRRMPPPSAGVRLLGPALAPISRLRGRTRWQLLLKGPTHLALAPLLNGDATYGPRHPQVMSGTNAESATYDPTEVNLLGPAHTPSGVSAPLNDFRFAYFANPTVLTPFEAERSFVNTLSVSNPPLLQPGQYAVLGPRAVTYFGSCEPSSARRQRFGSCEPMVSGPSIRSCATRPSRWSLHSIS